MSLFPARRRCSLQAALSAHLIPQFLLPISQSRTFSATSIQSSRIGGTPLSLPPDVDIRVLKLPVPKNGKRLNQEQPREFLEVQGPLGVMSIDLPPFVNFEMDPASRRALVTVQDRTIRQQREMWGTTRAYLQNHILGVSEGHSAILRLVGVGYRATIESTATTTTQAYPGQTFVSLKVGYSHPIELGIPLGVKASTPQPTRILLEGVNKEVVMQFAAKIREWRKPEPYKGKGIFVNGETIKLKAKKIK
ncbi:MAG: hypothetical protein M1829_006055 [Trizodia sp. TS-e1964]|nr:MAG: hypothetical protein M1829_006055 [Trizodia sp. TS-e1964]